MNEDAHKSHDWKAPVGYGGAGLRNATLLYECRRCGVGYETAATSETRPDVYGAYRVWDGQVYCTPTKSSDPHDHRR